MGQLHLTEPHGMGGGGKWVSDYVIPGLAST